MALAYFNTYYSILDDMQTADVHVGMNIYKQNCQQQCFEDESGEEWQFEHDMPQWIMERQDIGSVFSHSGK